jgi:hypothetical protein
MTDLTITKGTGVAVWNPEEDLKALGVWKCLSTTFTAVFPPGMEPDPKLVKECEEYDPGFVPVYCLKVFQTPANTEEAFGHYLICREVPTTDVKGEWDSKLPIRLQAYPRGWKRNPAAIYEVKSWTIPWPKGSPMIALGLPDITKEFDHALVDYVQQEAYAYKHQTKDQYRVWMAAFEENDRRQLREFTEHIQDVVKEEFKRVDTEAGMGWKDYTPKPFVETQSAE